MLILIIQADTLKNPPIADSKIKHYDDSVIIFRYLDHKTNTYSESSFSVFDFTAMEDFTVSDWANEQMQSLEVEYKNS